MKIFLILFIGVTSASAIVVNLQPGPEGKDTSVTSEEPDDNFGTLQIFVIGRDPDETLRSLIEWDLSSIPANQNIIEATMEICCYQIYGAGSPMITFYLINESWEEMTATWNNQPGYDGSVYTQGNWPSGANAWTSVDLTDIVSGWNDGTYDNYGIIGLQESVYTVAGFFSSDYTTPSLRPTLIVEYNPVGIESDSLGRIKASYH